MNIRHIANMDQLQALAASGDLIGLFDLSNELYHAGPGISSSGLKMLLRSPAHYEVYRATPPDTEAMRKGKAVHSYVLERDTFAAEYAVAPEIDRRTNAGKAAWEAFQIASASRSVLSGGDFNLCVNVALAISRNELASAALTSPDGHNELSVYWHDQVTGVLCKARADRLKNGVIYDLKTTQDAQPREFQRSIAAYAYHLSAAFYVDGFKTVLPGTPEFSWIAVEKSSPHGIAFYAASDETLAVGRAEYAQALQAYGAYQRREPGASVPGYPQRFQTIDLPKWYAPKEAAV